MATFKRYLVTFRSADEARMADVYAADPLEAVCIAKLDGALRDWRLVEVCRWPDDCADVEEAFRKLA